MIPNTLTLQHERVDDIPLLLGLMQQLQLPETLERALGSHHLHQGISNGWLACVWMAFILSEANHRKVSVQDWAQSHHHTLAAIIGQPLRPAEFSDDRLSIILRRFHDADWSGLESELWQATCQVYEVPITCIRLDSTTTCGYHTVEPDGLMQRGHSKDHRPDLPQLKLMAAAAQPTGHLLACDVHPGNAADDPLYVPLIERVRGLIGRRGLLYAGDNKMSALETRASIARQQDYYLVPLPQTGEVPQWLDTWVNAVVDGSQPVELLYLGFRRFQGRLSREIRPFFQCFDHVPQLSRIGGVGVNGGVEGCAPQHLHHMPQRPLTVPRAHPATQLLCLRQRMARGDVPDHDDRLHRP